MQRLEGGILKEVIENLFFEILDDFILQNFKSLNPQKMFYLFLIEPRFRKWIIHSNLMGKPIYLFCERCIKSKIKL